MHSLASRWQRLLHRPVRVNRPSGTSSAPEMMARPRPEASAARDPPVMAVTTRASGDRPAIAPRNIEGLPLSRSGFADGDRRFPVKEQRTQAVRRRRRVEAGQRCRYPKGPASAGPAARSPSGTASNQNQQHSACRSCGPPSRACVSRALESLAVRRGADRDRCADLSRPWRSSDLGIKIGPHDHRVHAGLQAGRRIADHRTMPSSAIGSSTVAGCSRPIGDQHAGDPACGHGHESSPAHAPCLSPGGLSRIVVGAAFRDSLAIRAESVTPVE